VTDKFNQDGSISENWLAEEITNREAGLREIDIAQVKEILKVTLNILAEIRNESDEDARKFDDLIRKHESIGSPDE